MSFEGRSKFKERKYSYIKKRKQDEENLQLQEDNLLPKIGKIVAFSPLLILGFIGKVIDKDSKISKYANGKIIHDNISNNDQEKNNTKKYNINTTISNSKEEPINIESQLKKAEKVNNECIALEQKIYLKIVKKLKKLKNNCEEIESEEYLISKYSSDHNLLEEANKIKEQIETLIKELETIEKEYNILKNKNLLEEPLPLEDFLLIEDIIKYRDYLKGESHIQDKIKILNTYTEVNDLLQDLKYKTEQLNKKSIDRTEKLTKRDEDYNKTKQKKVDIEKINTKINQTIDDYNNYQKELLSKINKLDKKTYTEYKLRGMEGFISTSCRYIGLLALTPLRGIVPQIGLQTKTTRKILNTMLDNMHYEKIEKTVYSAQNYINEIDNKIYNMAYVEKDLEEALSDINKLKLDFKEDFLKYNLKEYDKTYNNILFIEQNILRNQKKIDELKISLSKSKKQNKEVLTKVKKLNS